MISLALLIGVLGIGFVAFDRYTGDFRLQKLQRGAELLAMLDEPGSRPTLTGDSVLAGVHARLTENLEAALRPASLPSPVSPTVLKGLAGAAPWFLLLIAFLVLERAGRQGALGAAFGVFLFALVFGGLGMVIPTFRGGWVNYVLYRIVNFVVGLTAAVWYGTHIRK